MAVPALFDHKNIEELCRLVIDGMTMGAIAQAWKCKKSDIYLWMQSHEGHVKRYQDAKALAAADCDEQAMLAIQLATNSMELARARELASHLRWRAKMYARGGYTDMPETPKEPTKQESFVVVIPAKAASEDEWRSSTQTE